MNLREAGRHHEESFLFYNEDFRLIYIFFLIYTVLCIVIIMDVHVGVLPQIILYRLEILRGQFV